MVKFSLLVFSVFFVLSCDSQKQLTKTNTNIESKSEVMEQNNPLIGKWTLEYMSPVLGKDVKQLYKIQMPYLTFVDDEKVAGNNGCNNIAGTYSLKDTILLFDTEKFRSTRMFCQGVDEGAFINALKTINAFSVIDDGNKLVLRTGDIVSMSFVKSIESKD